MATKKLIYLDYSAATPLDGQALEAMKPYFADKFYNPSSTYSSSKEVKLAVDQARKTVAEILGAKKSEIIFTAGGTEANNLAIIGLAAKFKSGAFVATDIEHESVLEPLEYIKRRGGKVNLVKPDKTGIVKVEDILSKITDKTVLVSVIYANNEIGTIQPISTIGQKLARIRRERKKRGVKMPLYFHSDAAQAVNYLDTHTSRLGVDLMSINSGKIYGPKQCGALFVKGGVELSPLIFGGGQEHGLRSGTQNVPYIIGFAAALQKTANLRKAESARLKKLQNLFIGEIEKNISKVKINGSLKRRLPNNVHLTFEGIDNEELLIRLDEAGIQAASGSACNASSDEPSHVLRAIGLSDEQARSSIRFSLGRQTTGDDIIQTVKTLKNLLN